MTEEDFIPGNPLIPESIAIPYSGPDALCRLRQLADFFDGNNPNALAAKIADSFEEIPAISVMLCFMRFDLCAPITVEEKNHIHIFFLSKYYRLGRDQWFEMTKITAGNNFYYKQAKHKLAALFKKYAVILEQDLESRR